MPYSSNIGITEGTIRRCHSGVELLLLLHQLSYGLQVRDPLLFQVTRGLLQRLPLSSLS